MRLFWVTRNSRFNTIEPARITELLARWGEGRRDALDDLVPAVYSELRRLARARLAKERLVMKEYQSRKGLIVCTARRHMVVASAVTAVPWQDLPSILRGLTG